MYDYHSINNCSTIDMIGSRPSTTSSASCSSHFEPHVRDFYEAAARDAVSPALFVAPLDTQFGRASLLFNVVAALRDLQDGAHPTSTGTFRPFVTHDRHHNCRFQA